MILYSSHIEILATFNAPVSLCPYHAYSRKCFFQFSDIIRINQSAIMKLDLVKYK